MVKIAMIGAGSSSSEIEEETATHPPNEGVGASTALIDQQSLNLQLLVHKLNGKSYLEWAQSVKLTMEG